MLAKQIVIASVNTPMGHKIHNSSSSSSLSQGFSRLWILSPISYTEVKLGMDLLMARIKKDSNQ